jgi:3-hydroxy-3-methylglutaryl CoA synthase
MAGITSFGAYVPFHRLNRDELARAWEARTGGGQKAVASYDEDSVTMAVAAGLDCLKGLDAKKIEGIFLATTTSPYREKQAATIVATAVDCPREAFNADITDSVRSGSIAMNFALDAIESGRTKSIMVTVSDCRLGAPRGEFESLLGDGAAALLFGDSDVVASVQGRYSISNEILDVWKADKDAYLRSWEDRFVITQGYNKTVREAVQGLLKKYKLGPKDFAKVILYAPDTRSHMALAKALGFDPKTQVQDSLIGAIGHAGAAAPLMMLVAALEEAKPGDRLLFASYGDGSDAFVLQVTENINKLRNGRGVKKYLQSKTVPINYEKYLLWKGQIQVEPPRRLEPLVPSASALYRERKEILALYGQKCRRCGTVQYPPQRICVECYGRGEFDDYKFADKKAKVFTFAKEQTTAILEQPKIMCVIDFEGGGRMQTEVADRDPDEIKVGLQVEMTFRKLQDLKGIHHYFWKCKPVR